MRPVVILLTILALTSCALRADEANTRLPRLIITLKGDIQYRYDKGIAEARNGVRIHIHMDGKPDAIIHAQQAAYSLQSGQVIAQDGVTVGTAQGVFAGEHLTINAQTDEFLLRQAQAAIDATPDQPQSLLAYAFGEGIGRTGEVVYILRGRITTSDRRTPEYSLEAKRIEYYPSQRRFKVKGAALTLYGVRLPLIPEFSFKIGKEAQEKAPLIPLPGYSSKDKLYLPYQFSFAAPEAALQSDLTVRVTQHRGIRLRSENSYAGADWLAEGLVTQTEDYYNELGDHILLHRRPELRLTRFSSGPAQDTGWAASLVLANVVEELQIPWDDPRARPGMREQSAALGLRYDGHNDQRRAGIGQWYSVAARQSLYSTGDNYRDIALTAGAGRQITSNFRGSLSLTHHLLGGRTPFLHDAVNIRTELRPACKWRISPKWSLQANGLYDANKSTLRDYDMELRHRAHALTWGLHYRSIGTSLGLRVYLNGLTGDTAPYPQHHPLNQLYQQTQQELAAQQVEQ